MPPKKEQVKSSPIERVVSLEDLQDILQEISAGGVLKGKDDFNDYTRGWNESIERAKRIIVRQIKGEGLFQTY